tara:strand:+ start:15353 stop:15664 length:312 start_codon:yes stop_codon:yes gene_type:complete
VDPVIFLIQCLNAVQYGLLLFLVASGLTLIFGIMGIINLAHGSFYMIGAYMAFALGPLVEQYVGGGLLQPCSPALFCRPSWVTSWNGLFTAIFIIAITCSKSS